ncbi:MAG: formylglycine-generating enzyme family protein, partial [Anaerolineae bacterium]|nr:formylglycine-generating enzyme family protein [Anaerolineae bacterium]
TAAQGGGDNLALITLPTEQQWQRAAQGDDNRTYPWGNDFDQNRCNTSESGLKRPTSVSKYPNGVSPFGVVDIIGNVWEWCLSEWGTDKTDLTGDAARVVRGGSWYFNRGLARAASRSDYHPGNRDFDLGFRVVCRPPSP